MMRLVSGGGFVSVVGGNPKFDSVSKLNDKFVCLTGVGIFYLGVNFVRQLLQLLRSSGT